MKTFSAMNIQHIIVFWLVLTSGGSDPSATHSAYFRILHERAFQNANLCLSMDHDSHPVASFHQCQIACLTNRQCRTATFYSNTYQCNLFATRLDHGRLLPDDSAIVISLIERHSILTQITSPNNEIVGIWNTSVAQDSTLIRENAYAEGCSPPNQSVSKAIDNDILTKHVSYGHGRNYQKSDCAGHSTGFYIKPSQLSILTHICWGTSGELDETARDPMIITIEGSNETSSLNLVRGSSWSLIYNGTSGLDNHTPRSSYTLIPLNPFPASNSTAFRSYRLLVVKKRGSEDSVQYSEVQLYGYIIDE